ncbi:acyltransferase domain-containing protein, partial [Mycobacterium attenuatum]|uniref:acyltransferase domain-containing protein n=1 Tax=Mycobacterium attenuatum TaxID=2341086 RepID=UPI0010A95F62
PHLFTTHHHPHQPSKTVFVFPGQGAQYPTMATALYHHHRTFAHALDRCDEALHPYTGWSVRDVLCQDPPALPLERVDVVQPALFAVMIALAELLNSYGITAQAVIGHSQGEIAAAYIAGVYCLDDAAKIVARRSQALTQLRGSGAMASVLLSADELTPYLQRYGQGLHIAAINSPSQTIISGDPTALQRFSTSCQHHNIHIRTIAVDYASHCPDVEPLHQQLLTDLADLTPQPAHTPLYSSVDSYLSNQPLNTTTMTADYWYHNLRQPVHFAQCVTALAASGPHIFVELSPHPVLAPAINDTLHTTTSPGPGPGPGAGAGAGAPTAPNSDSTVITTLHRDKTPHDSLTTALAQLHI